MFRKKSACYSQVLVVSELVVSGTQCIKKSKQFNQSDVASGTTAVLTLTRSVNRPLQLLFRGHFFLGLKTKTFDEP